jgi:hypothetical protein
VKPIDFIIAATPVSDGDIAQFERDYGCLMPADLREFYRAYNGGCPANTFYPVPSRCEHFWREYGVGGDDPVGVQVLELYGLLPSQDRFSVEKVRSYERFRSLPDVYLPLGSDFCGNLVLLDQRDGSVYFRDNETDDVFYIAQDCLEFFDHLQEDSSQC